MEEVMGKAPEVTIIIPNYNGKQLLENCIETLRYQTFRDFEILVVDNGSTDGSAELTCDEPALRMIALKENTGFCGAVNIGIRSAHTPYVVLLNNDTEVEADFIEKLLAAIKRSERIFSAGALMIDYRDRTRIDNAGDYYTAFGWAIARGKGKPLLAYDKARRVFSCCAGAAIYRTELLREVGEFDENHFAYLEDVDMGYRARIYGYENWYAPQAKVYHVGSATTGTRYNEKKVFLAARNSMYLIYKNMPLLQKLINLPFILGGILIKTLFFAKKGFAGEYLHGIGEGIRTCSRCRRVRFTWRHLGNYVRIQLSLWGNIFRILFSV